MKNTRTTQIVRALAEPVEKLTYNTQEVCQALGISVTTLWRLEKAGKISPINSGLRMKLYSVQGLRKFINQ